MRRRDAVPVFAAVVVAVAAAGVVGYVALRLHAIDHAQDGTD